jgi:hypothetical protein
VTDQPDDVAAAASDATSPPASPSSTAQSPAQPSPIKPPPTVDDVPIEVLHRRAPRYGRFVLTGLLLGGVASFVTAIATSGWSGLSTSNTFWLLLMTLGVLGMLLGAVVALLVDRRSIAAIEAEAAAARTNRAAPTPTDAPDQEPTG